VTLAGFHESNGDRAASVSNELGVRAHATLPALLDDVNAAVIVVPNPVHFDVASQALERGIHLGGVEHPGKPIRPFPRIPEVGHHPRAVVGRLLLARRRRHGRQPRPRATGH